MTEKVVHIFPVDADWVRDRRWWPDTAYLAIPATQRRSWLPSGDEPLELASLCVPGNRVDPERVIRVYVPPYSVSLLKQAFGEMLLRYYPHLLRKQQQPGVEVKLFKTGGGSEAQQCRSLLKALSARRLQQSGFTAAQALAVARDRRVETYASIRAYRNAARKAKALIAGLKPHL